MMEKPQQGKKQKKQVAQKEPHVQQKEPIAEVHQVIKHDESVSANELILEDEDSIEAVPIQWYTASELKDVNMRIFDWLEKHKVAASNIFFHILKIFFELLLIATALYERISFC